MKIKIGAGTFEGRVFDEWWEDPEFTWTAAEVRSGTKAITIKDQERLKFNWDCKTQKWKGGEPADPIKFNPHYWSRGVSYRHPNFKNLDRDFSKLLHKFTGSKNDADLANKIVSKFGSSALPYSQLKQVVDKVKKFDFRLEIVAEYIRYRLFMPGAPRGSWFVISIPHHVTVDVFQLAECTETGKKALPPVFDLYPTGYADIPLQKTKWGKKLAKEYTEAELKRKIEEAKRLKKEMEGLKKEIKELEGG